MADGPFGSNLKREHYTSNKEARIIQLSNIGETGWREDNTRYTSFSHAATISRSIVSPGNLVIAKMMPAGRAIICPDVEKMYVLSSDAVKYVPSKELFNKYLLYAINSSVVLNQIHAEVHGVTRARTSIEKLRGYCVPIPPKEEQYRIVRCVDYWLSIVFALEHNKTVVADSIELARTKILELAIKGKLVSQDPLDEPAIELLKRINPAFAPSDNLHYEGQIPPGWQICHIFDIFDVTMGQSPEGNSLNKTDGIEFHQGKICFTGKYLSMSDVFTSEPTKFATSNSLLCCVRAPVGVFNITPRTICIGRGLCALTPRMDGVELDYWFYALSSFREYYEAKSTGTTFKSISGDIIRNTIVLLPPIREQKRIINKITELFTLLDHISNFINSSE